MKKIILIFLVFFISIIKSQMSWINGISILPSNPTDLDSITIYVDLSFSYSDCPLDHKYISVLGSVIQSSSHHCKLSSRPFPLGHRGSSWRGVKDVGIYRCPAWSRSSGRDLRPHGAADRIRGRGWVGLGPPAPAGAAASFPCRDARC